jgi:hypothetical protein
MQKINVTVRVAILVFAGFVTCDSTIASQQSTEKPANTWDLVRQEMINLFNQQNPFRRINLLSRLNLQKQQNLSNLLKHYKFKHRQVNVFCTFQSHVL